MELPLGSSINNKNSLNEKNIKLNLSKKFGVGYNDKDNISKYSNSRKEIYERKNLLSNNIENNIEKKNTNNYQSPKFKFQNNNIKKFKSNNSEVNIYNQRNQDNKKNIKLINEKNNNNEINKIIINYKEVNDNQANNNYTNSSNFNTDNNTLNTISNSNNSNNSNTMDNVNKTGTLSKNKKNMSSKINNVNTYKKEEYTEINNKGNTKKIYQIKGDNKGKFDNNRSTTNIHNYYKANIGQQIKSNNNDANKYYSNHFTRKNYNFNLSNNLNRMISSVNIDIKDKEKKNSRLKKNISTHYENLNQKNSLQMNDEGENKKLKNTNKKDVIINSYNKNHKNILINKKDNKIKDKISPNKNINNYIKASPYATSINYREKINQSINNKGIIISPQINADKKYKANYKEKNDYNRKNLNINICSKDIIATPNSKNINLIGAGNNSSSYSKSIPGSSSNKKYNNTKDRIITIKDNNYKINKENDYMNKNKGRILMNTNDISKLNRLLSKTEENNLIIRPNKVNNKNIKYFYSINEINKDNNKNENGKNKKDYSLYISPDKYNNSQESKKDYINNNIIYNIASSTKSKNKDNNNYMNEQNFILNKNIVNNNNISYSYKSSIFKSNKSDNSNSTEFKYKREENNNLKKTINKNLSNFSKNNKNDEFEYENEIEQFNITERIVEKEKKKIGTDSRTKIVKKNELKIAYSPNVNKNFNLNKDRIKEVSIKTNGILNKNRKINNLGNKTSNYSVNNTNNYINNNIILNKNNNFYVMNDINNNNDLLEESIDSLQKREVIPSSTLKINNKIYKKRSGNESKININNFNENNINKRKFINSPYMLNNFNSNNINNDNIFDFDTPLQNNTNAYINKTSVNDKINNTNFPNNIRINTIISRNNLLSERQLKENNKKINEHSNNFINIKKRNINDKSIEFKEIRNDKGSPKIYKKKIDYSKNRLFIIHRENKTNTIKDYNYSTEEKNIVNNISTNQKEFIKEIQGIYNEQKNNKNKIEINKVNNFEFNLNKKNYKIKPPIVIDENKKSIKNSVDKNLNKNIIEGNNNNINKKRLRSNKEKTHFDFNETKTRKEVILNKPFNKICFKYKFYYYNIKKNPIKGCYYSKLYKPKKPPKIAKDDNNTNNSFKNNKQLNSNNKDNVLPNDESHEVTFTEKIPALIDNHVNTINNDEIFITENSFKEKKLNNNINELTSNFNAPCEIQSNNNIKNNINNYTLTKNNENIDRKNKLHNQKNIEKDDLEMTFGIEEINNIQSKNNNNQPDSNININNFSTIHNNTNHSIVINEYTNNNNMNYNIINENINTNKLIHKENNIKNEKEQINVYSDDEEENQNEDFQILSEDEEIKKEEKEINNDNNNNNSITRVKEDKILQVTEGKEILGEIPDKINKGIKLLELFQIKRKSKNEFYTEKESLNNNDSDEIINKNNWNDNELLFNNEKRNNMFENELLNEDDIYKKRTNTFKPKKSNILIENLTKNKKCEILNGILTDIFDKKEKENNIYYNDSNSRSEKPSSNKSNEEDSEKSEANEEIIESKKNTYNPKKIEKYSKIFNLNTIKNLEEILNKKRTNKIFDFINIDELDDEFKSNRQSLLTYNKKLKNNNKDELLFDNDYSNKSNIFFEKGNYNSNTTGNNLTNNLINFDGPKLNDEEKIGNKKIFSYEEILNYNKKNDICSKENFLTSEVISHCDQLLNYIEIEYIKANFTKKYNDNNRKWTKKDLSKEIKEAEEYVKNLNIEMKKDSFKFEIMEILNTITVDNYEEILNKLSLLIYEIDNKNCNNIKIKPEILLDKQYRFAEIIIDKAIMEKGYVKLYAILCYDLFLILNKIVDNYIDINIKNQLSNSENLKSLLIGECKQRFTDYQYNNKINENDFDTIFLIKKKFLGNINFIVELISVKLFSQKIGFDILDILYQNYHGKKINDKNKYLNLEGIITLLNKFGKIISERKNEKYLQNLNNYINDFIIPLVDDKNNIPSHLKYKLINLIEKQKNNWEESLYEKSIMAKGKNTNIIKPNLNCEEIAQDDNINQNESNDNINNFNIINNKKSENNYHFYYNESNSERIKLNIKKEDFHKKNNSMELIFNGNYFDSLNDLNEEIDIDNNHKIQEIDEEEIINTLKKDFNDFLSFQKRKESKNSQSNKFFDEDYDWIIIDNIISKNNIKLDEIILYIIEIFIDLISKDNIFYGNQYILNIINYFLINPEKKGIQIIHDKMKELIVNINNIILENNNMFEIFGNLFFCLISKKLFYIKDFNSLINEETTTIINISKIIKYIIITSDTYKKQYYNKFKQLELFTNNDIFDKYIKMPLKDYYGYEIDKTIDI